MGGQEGLLYSLPPLTRAGHVGGRRGGTWYKEGQKK